MNVFGIILIIALVGLVTYLLIDTTIYIVKKAKLKKQEKEKKDISQDTTKE